MSPSLPKDSRTRGLGWPALILSIAVLAQELLLVRLIAVPLWHHVTYMVVTSALLAFGVAGTLLAVLPVLGGRTSEGGRRWFAVHALLFAASTFVTAQALGRTELDTIDLLKRPRLVLDLFGLYLLVGLPLLFGGLAIATALRHAGPSVSRVYFANLLGSGVGCAVFLLLLSPLGGPGLLVGTALLAVVAAIVAARARWAVGIGAVFAGVAFLAAIAPDVRDRILPEPRPVASKELNRYLDAGHEIELTLWDTLCRIDVTGLPDAPPGTSKMIFQDGDAPTFLYPPGAPEATETSVPYIIHPDAKSILVIGAGGGRELRLASEKGLHRIVGVEINPSTVSLLEEHYRDFTGDVAHLPGVELINAEGRAWLARSRETFDFIQMTGVDTYAALHSGAYVASESYLYTAQAFDAYLDHLKPGGYFSIIRLYFTPDRETLRLYVMALDALQRRGVTDPGRHAVVVRSGAWGILVVGLSPIPEERMEEVRGIVTELTAGNPEGRDGIVYDPWRRLEGPFTDYADAIRAGTEEEFFEGYPFDVRPVDDDSPFFYLYHHWGTVIGRLLSGGDDAPTEQSTALGPADPWRTNTGEIPTGQVVLLALLVQALVVGILLVLGPLLVFKLRALAIPGTARTVIYFTCLGLAFMLLEIALAQKLTLFLGHPTLSLSVVIGGMLVFSGLGSLVSGGFRPERAMLVTPLLVAVLAGALVYLLPQITTAWLEADQRTRILLALVVIAPLGFVMGMPMPSGLRRLGEHGRDLIPWAWGVNGVASVFGSVLAIVLAMGTGFTGVLLAAAGLYVVAAACRVR